MASYVVIVADSENELSLKIEEYVTSHPGLYSAGKVWDRVTYRKGKPVKTFMRFLRVGWLPKTSTTRKIA